MDDLRDSLNEYNAVIEEEIDVYKMKHYFLKIRFAPENSVSVKEENLLSFTDTFYDLPNFENTKKQPNIFHLARKDETSGKTVWVRQMSRSLNNRSHVCVGEVLSKTEIENVRSSMNQFLVYRFQRFYFQKDLDVNRQEVFSMYLDRITAPFSYDVITCKIRISEDINALTSDKIRELVTAHCPSQGLPIYSKFSYMLQCSEHFDLQEALMPEDIVFDQMQQKMGHQNHLDHQDYLWNFERIVQFQNIYTIVKNQQDTIERVKKLEEQFVKGVFKVSVSIDSTLDDLL